MFKSSSKPAIRFIELYETYNFSDIHLYLNQVKTDLLKNSDFKIEGIYLKINFLSFQFFLKI